MASMLMINSETIYGEEKYSQQGSQFQRHLLKIIQIFWKINLKTDKKQQFFREEECLR